MDAFPKRLAGLRERTPVTADAQFLSDLDREKFAEFRREWPLLPPATRRALVAAMCTLSEDHVEYHFGRALRVTMHDEDPTIRIQSLDGLWEDSGEDLLRHLLDAGLNDPDEGVRIAAVRALRRFSVLAVEGRLDAKWYGCLRDRLLELARHGVPAELQRRALEAVAAFPDDIAVRETIEAAYQTDDTDRRMSAIYAMSQNLDPRWLPFIRSELDSPHAGTRYEAARAAGAVGHRGAVPRLTELLGDADREVQLAAIQSLGQIGGSGPVSVLKRLAVSRDDAVREAAEEALEEAAFMTDAAMPAQLQRRGDTD